MRKNKFILCLLLIVCAITVSAQKQSEKLKKKQQEVLKKIETIKSMFGEIVLSERMSITELAILNQQIAHREELIDNYSQQVKKINQQIEENKYMILSLNEDNKRLKNRYKELIRYAYRHRNTYHRLLFVFASKSFNQAYQRSKYIRQFTEYRKKQMRLIQQTETDIVKKQEELKLKKQEKEGLVTQQASEKENYVKDKEKQQEALSKLKSQEQRLKKELKEQQETKERIAQQIRKAIEKEIREQQLLEEKRRKEEEARNRKNDKTIPEKTGSGDKKTNTTKRPTIDPNKVSPETLIESEGFEAAKGKLPWPVEKGEITSHFGHNPHPTLAGVMLNNNGIDIGTGKGAGVRSVFEGTVTSVFVIPGAGKGVIISHGIYRTVYANLADVSVTKGSKVKTKQNIGTLLPGESGSISQAHFEIWKVTSEDMVKQNPSLWLYK